MDIQEDTTINKKMTLSERARLITPKDLIVPAVIFVLFLGATVGIINYQNKAKLKKAPEIEISKPVDGLTTEDAQIVLEGKTQTGATVLVNEKEVTVDNKGQFASEVALAEGTNQINIVVTNKAGVKSEKQVNIMRGTVAVSAPAAVPSIPTPVTATSVNQPSQSTHLNSAGPETFWALESLTLSGIGAAWALSRRNLKKIIRK
jgi:hypothetical protein